MGLDRFELLPDSGQPPEVTCCQRLHTIFTTHPCLYGFMFITILTLDLAEMTNDWLFLKDVLYLEQGLVYGPLSPIVVVILLISSGIGSVAIVFEIFNIFRDIINGQPWVDLDLVSCLVVWLEEIPTMTTIFVISMCHNEPVSIYQLTKALIVIMSVILRIFVPLIRTYLRGKNTETPPTVAHFRKSVYKVVTTIGLCLTLCSAIMIFIFTHIIAMDERKFEFRLPQEIWAGKYAHEKYFTDVGIYFHHIGLKESTGEEYWLKLANIDEFYDKDTINLKISYVKSGGVIQRLRINSYTVTDERFRECYVYQKATSLLREYVIADCQEDFLSENGNQENVIFKFVFLKPQNHFILGTIIYNIKYRKDNTCYDLVANRTHILDKSTGPTEILFGRLLYLKQKTTIYSNHRLVHRNLSTNQMTDGNQYSIDQQLVEADDIWKTGMYGCDCTGKKGPSFNNSMTLTC